MTTVPVRWRNAAWLLSWALLLSIGAAVRAEYKPLTKEEQAKVDRAIERGVAFLKKTQTPQGDWLWKMYNEGGFLVGQCALPAYALMEAGLPADDPIIKKAAKYLRSRSLRTDSVYEISLAILFFDRLGDSNDKHLIQTLALRLIAGQHLSGGWSYHCPVPNEKNEQDLLKCLGQLSKRMEGKERVRDDALIGFEVPTDLQLLTVFQRASALSWQEPFPSEKKFREAITFTSLDGMTDNSNTQFAMLGLWTARRYDIPTEATFEIMTERFERFQAYPGGFWEYVQSAGRPSASGSGSMTCVGLLGLAIGRGLKLPTPGSPSSVEKDIHVLKGLTALSRDIGTPLGHMNKRMPLLDLYFLWSLERVGSLYNLPTIVEKDWYRWGAENLVTNQLKNGAWPGPHSGVRVCDYKACMNTAFVLLFLKRSHPMKDLTPKLPFTAKQLNEDIARLRPDDKFPVHSVTAPSQSRNLEGATIPPSQSKKPRP